YALVLDVIAEVHDHVGPHEIVHARDESAREPPRFLRELSELALVPRFGTEMQVRDKRERQIHARRDARFSRLSNRRDTPATRNRGGPPPPPRPTIVRGPTTRAIPPRTRSRAAR